MYCIKCGAKLSDGQTVCPICDTRVYHPDMQINEESTYPKIPFKSEEINRTGLMFIVTFLFLIPLLLPVFLELSWHDRIDWSGYVFGGTVVFYVTFILPCWFKKPNYVIFVPCSLASVILLLLYICLATGGSWFMPFAFPVVGSFAIIASALTAVLKYVKGSALYATGGALIALGLWTVLLELLIRGVFDANYLFMWSSATLTVFSVFGILLIMIAIIKPLKETFMRVFFVGRVK